MDRREFLMMPLALDTALRPPAAAVSRRVPRSGTAPPQGRAVLACTVRARLFISGVVQGVSYRASTQEQARRRGIVGWVKNLEDGRVEALAQGSKDQMTELLAWCRKGPPAAKVEKVDVSWEEVGDEFRSFEVRY